MSINESLEHLSNVIRQLAEGKAPTQINYDSHVLTKAMKDSLGGNAKTLMLVNLSPSIYNIDQTRNTLNFAMSTGMIVNKPGVLISDTASQQKKVEEDPDLLPLIQKCLVSGDELSKLRKNMGPFSYLPKPLSDGVHREMRSL